MVKVSTLFHRVDGFDESGTYIFVTEPMDLAAGDHFLTELLSPLMFDPGDKLVHAILEKV